MVETRTEPRVDAPPALWETDVEHPAGGLWRVRTQDLEREPLQMPAAMIKTLLDNRGRFFTTVYGPDGGQYKATYSANRTEADEFHNRMVARIQTGTL
jgi:hypothetical protein